jgi:hypothetical protein
MSNDAVEGVLVGIEVYFELLQKELQIRGNVLCLPRFKSRIDNLVVIIDSNINC